MDEQRKDMDHKNSLAYSLPENVHFTERSPVLYLIRKNPLSTITLNQVWKHILEKMSEGEFVSFKEILSLVHSTPDKTAIYLDSLVRKGFMESIGYRKLDNYPLITIIIPVRNRPDEIADCLTSLEKLDYPPEKTEIIVIDDASDDSTSEVISRFPVKLIKNSSQMGASYCRNLAAGESKGDILAFLDSDCVADSLWLKELVPAFSDEANGAVGGKVDSWFGEKLLDRYEKVSSSLNMGKRSKSSKEDGSFFYVPTCNLLVKKDIFFELEGFNENVSVGEDVDFCWRLKDRGFEIEYRPAGVVFHKHRNKTGAFFVRRFQYGTSEPFLQKKHPDRVKEMFYLPLTTLLWSLVLVSFLIGQYLLLGICVIILVINTHTKWTQVKREDLPIKYSQVLLAVFRGYFVSMYYWCEFFSRYYLFITIILLPIYPVVSLIIFLNHVIVSVYEYYLRIPPLNIIGFFYLFTLDQLAYQLGVWFGCFKYMSFNPVNPKISRWTS
jgi:mycofactocin system glycosyltransferase